MTAATGAGANGTPALASLASGAGCGCKLPAADLLAIVGALPKQVAPHLLVGAATADDAAVFQVREDLALVPTLDFFTPMVDDPKTSVASPQRTLSRTSTRWAERR